MKLINKILCAAVLLMGWTACTNEDAELMREATKVTELKLALAMEEFQSRAAYEDLSHLDRMSISIYNNNVDGNISLQYSYANIEVIKKDGRWIPKTSIYIHENDPMDIQVRAGNWSLEAEQSKTSYKSDALASSVLQLTPQGKDETQEMYFKDGILMLKMKHMMAQLTLVLELDESMNLTADDLENIDKKIIVHNGGDRFWSEYWSDWHITFVDEPFDIMPYLDSVDNAEKVKRATYKCILAPEKEVWIEIKIGGKVFKWTDTNKVLKLTGGKNTTLTLKLAVKKEAAATASVSRSAWTE